MFPPHMLTVTPIGSNANAGTGMVRHLTAERSELIGPHCYKLIDIALLIKYIDAFLKINTTQLAQSLRYPLIKQTVVIQSVPC